MPTPILRLGPPGRNLFYSVLNKHGLTGTGVEIGTHRGDFARELIRTWGGKVLYCVDPWMAGYDPMDPASQGNREEDERACRKTLRRFMLNGRVRILKTTSGRALSHFSENSLDFVYIDGNHQPAFFSHDIEEWYPKLKEGGILAGHDFLCPGEANDGWGRFIQPILYNFAARKAANIYLMPEPDNSPWSWYLFRSLLSKGETDDA